MEGDRMAVKNKLNELIETEGIKQSWLVEKTRLNKGTISNVVNGKGEPSISVCLKIARALNLKVEDIFYDDEYLEEIISCVHEESSEYIIENRNIYDVELIVVTNSSVKTIEVIDEIRKNKNSIVSAKIKKIEKVID
jgi:DNA-binding XRE family transcriptional regulator